MRSPILRRRGPRPLADLAEAPLAEALKKAGFAATEVVTAWGEIVGEDLARRCAPIRIAWPRRAPEAGDPPPGTLHVRVETPFALEVQHLAPVIVERVNGYFGWRCVAGLRLTQVPMRRHAAGKAPPPAPADEARLSAALDGIEDAGLKAAIARLGRAVGRSG